MRKIALGIVIFFFLIFDQLIRLFFTLNYPDKDIFETAEIRFRIVPLWGILMSSCLLFLDLREKKKIGLKNLLVYIFVPIVFQILAVKTLNVMFNCGIR